MIDTVVRNLKVLSEFGWEVADLGLDGGQICELSGAVNVPSREEVDAEGAYCFPGGVDLHVHFNEPGRTHWEGFETGSAAAAAGGVTYVAEMPLNSIPSTVSVKALEQKLAVIGRKSAVDFGLWGGLVPGNIDELIPMARAGVMGFKAFMSPSGTDDFINSDTSVLRSGMQQIAKTGLRLALHAEEPSVLSQAEARLKQRKSAYDWEQSRPIEAELRAVEIAIELSVETGCPITIVHVSAPEVLKVICAAKVRGVDVLCETCPHYLLMSIEDAEVIGAAAKCAPPLRPGGVVQGLRSAFLTDVDTLGSDHSPCPPELKSGQPFYDAWGGISGLQHGLPLLVESYGIDNLKAMQRLQATSARTPAQIQQLANKGSLEIGMDADFFLLKQREFAREIAVDDLVYRHAQSAYVGRMSRLEVEQTWLRGRCIYLNGKLTSKPTGKYILGVGRERV